MLRASAHRDRRSGVLLQGTASARGSGCRGGRLRGRQRRPQHRVVGGGGGGGSRHPALRGAMAAASCRQSPGPSASRRPRRSRSSTDSYWCSRRGSCATNASMRRWCSITVSTWTSASQIRAAGRKLLVADLHVVHHRSLELIADLDVWVEAHIRVAEKWDGASRRPPTRAPRPTTRMEASAQESPRPGARRPGRSRSLRRCMLDAGCSSSSARWPRRPTACRGA